ncbi:ATP-binding protein [Catenuloplanes sp. NPDC051500]|uniref:ATP-binding protein n=1 Tax=Catenuloplanes sp. NPDC051500 TaxID=3363959 RepID=UPI0037A48685
MNSADSRNRVVELFHELCGLARETGWVEFKENNDTPERIGEYVSALSNSAALDNRPRGYLIWGVRDGDHAVVGTTFDPTAAKVGNEDYHNWLLRGLDPQIHFSFHSLTINDRQVVLLEIDAAAHRPVSFKVVEYVRVGSYKKRLRDHPDHARRLWSTFARTPFERGVAANHLTDDEVLRLFDYPAYFHLLNVPLPETRTGVMQALAADDMVLPEPAGRWSITNLGACLFGKRITAFPTLRRKAARVIQYRGISRIETIKEHVVDHGYASGFESLLDHINGLLPSNEIIGQALRQTVKMYPALAVRELVANALIHQDFSITGAGPMMEIFDDRIEITNPGLPLIDPGRFVDSPPRSRNEQIAAVTRRVGICEERGSGWDKIGFEIELHQLPAPLIEVVGDHVRITLFSYRELRKMNREDRVRALYLHACLRYVTRQRATNTSVRERFGIEARNSAKASRLIKEAVDDGYIAPRDATASRKLMEYVPFWAAPRSESTSPEGS